MIAVHCGAGHISSKSELKYKKLCSKACKAGMAVLQNGGTALEAAQAAVIVLENDPITNAGRGSNLTTSGHVECDAAIMNGDTLLYGGCGAVKRVKNPIALASDICVKQLSEQPLSLVPPSLLVGSGALLHAKRNGLDVVKGSDLITAKAQKQLDTYSKLLRGHEKLLEADIKMDTVGAICCDKNGQVVAASSSGGLLLKRPGRVGQAALYGSGVWADSYAKDSEASVAVCTTGCGEHLVQTLLAKEIAEDLKLCTCPTTSIYKTMTDKFIRETLDSRYLKRVDSRNGGALALHISNTGEGTLLWTHSTSDMTLGYMRSRDKKPKTILSRLPLESTVGASVTVGGSSFSKD